jgi:hypothetical protein
MMLRRHRRSALLSRPRRAPGPRPETGGCFAPMTERIPRAFGHQHGDPRGLWTHQARLRERQEAGNAGLGLIVEVRRHHGAPPPTPTARRIEGSGSQRSSPISARPFMPNSAHIEGGARAGDRPASRAASGPAPRRELPDYWQHFETHRAITPPSARRRPRLAQPPSPITPRARPTADRPRARPSPRSPHSSKPHAAAWPAGPGGRASCARPVGWA